MVLAESDNVQMETTSIVDPFSANNSTNAGNNNNNNGPSGMVGESNQVTNGVSIASAPTGAAGGSTSYSFHGKPRSLQKSRLGTNEENRQENLVGD